MIQPDPTGNSAITIHKQVLWDFGCETPRWGISYASLDERKIADGALSIPLMPPSLSTDHAWVVRGKERILWLPPEYRPSTWAVIGSTVVLGQEDGQVLFLVFNTTGYEMIRPSSPSSRDLQYIDSDRQ